MSTFKLANEDSTVVLAKSVANALPEAPQGWLLLLQGELGAGKSTFARAVLRELGQDGPIPSPTYTLVEPYELRCGRVYHIDLYRVISLDELEFLGWDDIRDGLVLLEWPERVSELFDQADILIRLEYEGESRVAELCAGSVRGEGLVESVGKQQNSG